MSYIATHHSSWHKQLFLALPNGSAVVPRHYRAWEGTCFLLYFLPFHWIFLSNRVPFRHLLYESATFSFRGNPKEIYLVSKIFLILTKVLHTFVLAFRIMKLIIAERGNNAWLSHGTPHLNVRSDYTDSETGIWRKQTFGDVNM